MIKAKLLNSEASLNDYFYLGALDFVPGETVDIALQIFLTQRDIRFVPPSAATLTATMIDSNGDDIVIEAELIDADDRSMWIISLTPEQSETLAGQNIELTLDVEGNGTIIYKTLMDNVLSRNNLAGDC